MRTIAVRCFKCGKKGHKYRECPLWEKKERRVVRSIKRKAHQREKKQLRRAKKKKVIHPVQGKAQQAYRRPLIEELRKRAEEHCGKGVLEEIQLWDLGWCTREVVVFYLVCEKCEEKGCHVKDNRGQRVISRRKLEEIK